MRITWKYGLGMGLFALALGVGGVWNSGPQVVLFDTDQVQAQLIRQLALHQATDAQIANASKKLKRILPKVINEYATKHHVLVIEKHRVLGGGVDVTSELMLMLSTAMRSSV